MIVTTVIGNLGADCRTNTVSGTAVCNFTVAGKSGFGDREQTLWFDCALWGKQAESKLVDYLKKGQLVAVSGEQGEKEHNGKTYHTLRVEKIRLCGGQSEAKPVQQSSQQPAHNTVPADDFDDDIPF